MLRGPFQQDESSPPLTTTPPPLLPAMSEGTGDAAFMLDCVGIPCILDGQDLPQPDDLRAAVARSCIFSVFDVLAKWRKFFKNQTGGMIYASLTGEALTLAMAIERVDIVSLLVDLRGLENGEVRTALSAGHICNFEALLWNG